MADCVHLPGCGFCKKYMGTKNLAVQGFVKIYCKGAKQNECKRKEFAEKTGNRPPDNMMPSGQTIAG